MSTKTPVIQEGNFHKPLQPADTLDPAALPKATTGTPGIAEVQGTSGIGVTNPTPGSFVVKENFDGLPAAPSTLPATATVAIANDGVNSDGSQATLAQLAAALIAAAPTTVSTASGLQGDGTASAPIKENFDGLPSETAATFEIVTANGASPDGARATLAQLVSAITPLLPAEKFLQSASYNPGTKILTLTLTDSSSVTVNLQDLLPITSVSGIQGDGTTATPIKENFDALPAAATILPASTTFVVAQDGANPDGAQATIAQVKTALGLPPAPYTASVGVQLIGPDFRADLDTLPAAAVGPLPAATKFAISGGDGQLADASQVASLLLTATTAPAPVTTTPPDFAIPTTYVGQANNFYLAEPKGWIRVASALSSTGYIAIPVYEVA